jgi:3-oxoadipate enol-lactonase
MPFITLPAVGQEPALMLHYESWGQPSAQPTLVLVHELGGTLESFREFAQQLAPRHHVVAYDQRGCGLSEKPGVPYGLDALGQDIGRLVEALDLRGPFNLMGLALGAVVALHYARQSMPRVRSLILCDGTSGIDENARGYLLNRAEKIRRQGMRSVLESSLKNSFRGLLEGPLPDFYLRYSDQFLTNCPNSYAQHSEALAQMALDDQDFQRISCPVLVATGRNDFIWPIPTGEELAAKLTNARFQVVEGAAHFPPIQQCALTARYVQEFFDSNA